jgi:acetyl-CoA carboxylase biotin carboxylase subunit
MMFKKIIIANRGEIAVRIINAAREMGIKTVAVYSDFDEYSIFTKIADEAYRLGESPASKSYLIAEKIIEIAKASGAEAIHPGYGFLSERSYFAKLCEDSGIKFIGPSSAAIELLGNKIAAREIALKNNVPVVPGTAKPVKELNKIISAADAIGYPVIIKASAGGGGKGMRIVDSKDDLESSVRMAQNEARSSFGDENVFIEKYILNPRHIEFQILADEHGNVIHLGERECSMQRRNQKIIEESPSVIMNEELRTAMSDCAVRIAKSSEYSNAGTVEFIVDKDKNFYFLEVNTRLQVEHPVTELRTGIDLVKVQIKIACGEKLQYAQSDIKFEGHSIECRICAEDPMNNFIPSTGKINYLRKIHGNGIREDTGLEEGDEVPVYYDPMISKLISLAPDRNNAITKMTRSLEDYRLSGVKTNISFLKSLMLSNEFRTGEYDTQFIERSFLEKYKDKINNRKEDILFLDLAAAVYSDRMKNTGKQLSNLNSLPESNWKKKRTENMR